jgi:tetratricopeptide (TPR) repeat protein
MTEELITDLAQISGLKVISHTSVIQFARSSKPLPQIAHELGVDGIVEGTVQRSGNRVRITAQLIYAPEEQHLWAASYDRDVQDVLTLQSSVAAAIVEPIRAKTGPAQTVPRKPPSTPSLSVLEEYFQGKYSLERMASGDGDAGHKAAIGHFKQAISEDPDFAPAYEKLAETYDSDFEWRRGTMVPLEKALLGKALELDPGSADAHLFIAHIKRDYDCDLAGAETEYKEAIRLNSNLAEAHDEFSAYLDIVGRREESIQEAHRAQELDPAGNHESDVMMEKGQYDRQIAQLRKQLEIHPNDGFTYLALIDVYQTAGMQRETVKSMQQAWTLFGFKEIGLGMGKAYASSGYKGAIRYSATQMERLGVEGKVYSPRRIASWYAWIGDKEQSLKWLTAGLAEGNYCWVGLNSDPDFALLHSDPRFQELAKRAAVPR